MCCCALSPCPPGACEGQKCGVPGTRSIMRGPGIRPRSPAGQRRPVTAEPPEFRASVAVMRLHDIRSCQSHCLAELIVRAGADAAAMLGHCLLLMASSAPRPTCPGLAPPTVRRAFSHQSPGKTMHRGLAHRPARWSGFLTEVPSSECFVELTQDKPAAPCLCSSMSPVLK
jgi:hypothetical protein